MTDKMKYQGAAEALRERVKATHSDARYTAVCKKKNTSRNAAS